jgi:hypothetical protein
MRDAAALIILQMDKATGISKLSQANAQDAVPPSDPTTEDLTLQTAAEETSPDESG